MSYIIRIDWPETVTVILSIFLLVIQIMCECQQRLYLFLLHSFTVLYTSIQSWVCQQWDRPLTIIVAVFKYPKIRPRVVARECLNKTLLLKYWLNIPLLEWMISWFHFVVWIKKSQNLVTKAEEVVQWISFRLIQIRLFYKTKFATRLVWN